MTQVGPYVNPDNTTSATISENVVYNKISYEASEFNLLIKFTIFWYFCVLCYFFCINFITLIILNTNNAQLIR